MKLQEALDLINTGDLTISRPYLLHERNTFITYEGPNRPLKLRRLHHPELATDWVPSPTELLAQDWCVLAHDWRGPASASSDSK